MQHDFEITTADANTGPSMRAAINEALQALASSSIGPAAPTTTYAGMFWADTTAGVIKQRNSGNTAWIERWELDDALSPGMVKNTSDDNSPDFLTAKLVSHFSSNLFNRNILINPVCKLSSIFFTASSVANLYERNMWRRVTSDTSIDTLASRLPCTQYENCFALESDGTTVASIGQRNLEMKSLLDGSTLTFSFEIVEMDSANLVVEGLGLNQTFSATGEHSVTFDVDSGSAYYHDAELRLATDSTGARVVLRNLKLEHGSVPTGFFYDIVDDRIKSSAYFNMILCVECQGSATTKGFIGMAHATTDTYVGGHIDLPIITTAYMGNPFPNIADGEIRFSESSVSFTWVPVDAGGSIINFSLGDIEASFRNNGEMGILKFILPGITSDLGAGALYINTHDSVYAAIDSQYYV